MDNVCRPMPFCPKLVHKVKDFMLAQHWPAGDQILSSVSLHVRWATGQRNVGPTTDSNVGQTDVHTCRLGQFTANVVPT